MSALLLLVRHPVAHRTAAYTAQDITRFEGLRSLRDKHLANSGKPEAVFIGKIVTGTATMALKERIVVESPEARTGRGKRLPAATTTSSSVLTRKKNKKIQ